MLNKILFARKDNSKEPDKEDLKLAMYRWEFLRRITEYREDYLKQCKNLSKKRDDKYYEFCTKWKIGKPFNPKKSFNELFLDLCKDFIELNKLQRPLKEWEKNSTKSYLVDSLISDYLPFETPVDGTSNFEKKPYGDELFPSMELLHQGFLKINVNLNYSKNIIEKKFKEKLDIWKGMYDRNMEYYRKTVQRHKETIRDGNMDEEERDWYIQEINVLQGFIDGQDRIINKIVQSQPIPLSRKEFKHYDDYLRVFDLVEEKKKKGKRWTWEQIAKEIFPEEFKEPSELKETDPDQNPETAITNVKNYYKKASILMKRMQPTTEKQS